MLLPIPSPAPGVVINNDTSTASVRYPVFAAITNGQAVKEYVSSSKLYYTPSTGVLNATGFAGSGTGLTGTASSLSIGGNAATATLATAATNLAGGVANNMAYQTSAGATAFITAPSISGSYLQWTSVGGFAWTAFNGVTSFSAASTGLTPNVATTGAITLGGTLSAAYGGTGANTLTGYVYGNATGAMTASSTIPNTAITGLGTMSTQNANSVAITGGAINGTAIGGSVAASGAFTYVTANQPITGASSIGAFSYGTLSYSDVNLFASYKTNVNSYAQIVIQNTAVGTSASTDFVVSNDLGSSSSNYGDFGINSSAFVGTGSLGAAGYVYMYAQGTDLAIGTGTNNAIHLVVNGGATDAMTINGSGALAFNGSYGTSSYLLQAGGSAAAPSWINPSSLSVGSANNLLGGNSGYVAYQSAANTTAFVSAGITGQVFTSGGTGSPTWTSQSALSVGTATNVAGGAANQIVYQTGTGATLFLNAPTTSGTYLQWTGSAFAWLAATAGAGGSTTQVQYNSSGVLAGSANMTFNGTSLTLNNDATIHTLTVGLGNGSQANSTAFGFQALNATNTGTNTAIGYTAGKAITSGNSNVFVGQYSGSTLTSANYNTGIGHGALYASNGSNNTALGFQALNFLTSGQSNTSIGNQAGENLTTGGQNVIVGNNAMFAGITGSTNVAVGNQAMQQSTGVSGMVAIGSGALVNTTTTLNTGTTNVGTITPGSGYVAGTYTAVALSKIATGGGTSVINGGSYGTATVVVNADGTVHAGGVTIVNPGSGYVDTTTVLTVSNTLLGGSGSGFQFTLTGSLLSASQNVGIGSNAIITNSTGSNITAVGYQAGNNATTGSNNVFVGTNAGVTSVASTTGSQLVYVGSGAHGSAATNQNEIVIGYNAVGLGSNTTTIGVSGTTALTQVYGTLNTSGYTFSTLPSTAATGKVTGARTFITDASTASAAIFGGAVAGGGSVTIPVFYNGTTWIVG